MAVNVEYKVTGGKLVITCDIGLAACNTAKLSDTGKTYLVAKTGSAIEVQGPAGWDLKFALNVMGKKTGDD